MSKEWQDIQTKEYELAIVISNCQPVHFGQVHDIDMGLNIANKVLILIGSAYNSKSPDNPFTYEQRTKMIREHYYQSKDRDNIIIEPLADYIYEENQWITDVQEIVSQYANKNIAILGNEEYSYYVKNFPQWKIINTGVWLPGIVNSKDILDAYFEHKLAFVSNVVPSATYNFLEWFSTTQEYADLVEEKNYIETYKGLWANVPFPATFSTVDAVVIQSGHILLIKRNTYPGKGLIALPGGFIDKTETQEDAILRVLREETKLKVPVPVLRGSIKKEKTFSDPMRSSRGRTITQAYLFQLKNDEPLPKVKGSDHAQEAAWYTLADFYNMEDQMYEDHFYIAKKMIDNE